MTCVVQFVELVMSVTLHVMALSIGMRCIRLSGREKCIDAKKKIVIKCTLIAHINVEIQRSDGQIVNLQQKVLCPTVKRDVLWQNEISGNTMKSFISATFDYFGTVVDEASKISSRRRRQIDALCKFLCQEFMLLTKTIFCEYMS